MDMEQFDQIVAAKGEFELKYAFLNFQAPVLEEWILCHCRRDTAYPVSRVQSIYLETLARDSYAEKINSDFYKTKYRARWYEDPALTATEDCGERTIFLEKKMKVGSKRLKSRSTIALPLTEIRELNLASPFHGLWHRLFAENGDTGFLEPFVQISYIRKRFVDPVTQARFSLDCDIRVERSNPLYLPSPSVAVLPHGVFEIKSSSNRPPESMHYLTNHLAQKTCFSKYARCVSLLIQH